MKDTKKKNLMIAGLAVATTVGFGCSVSNATEENADEQLQIINNETNTEINENVETPTYSGFLEINLNIPEAGKVSVTCSGFTDSTNDEGSYSKYFADCPTFSATAYQNDGYVFVGWYNGNTLLSTSYTITDDIGTTGTSLIAKFEKVVKLHIANDSKTSAALHVVYSSPELPEARAGLYADPNLPLLNGWCNHTLNFLNQTVINITLDEIVGTSYVMDGYTFDGWYYSDSNILITHDRNIQNFVLSEDTTIEPRFTKIDITPYLFNSTYYADMNKDVRAVFGYDEDLLKKHYEEYGIKEGRQASPIFNAKYYLDANPELKTLYGEDGYEEAYNHFVNYGAAEGKEASGFYNSTSYWANYPTYQTDDKYSNTAALIRFATSGIENGEKGKYFDPIEYKNDTARPYLVNKVGNDYIRYYADFQDAEMFDNDPIEIEDHMFDATVYYYANPDLQAAIGFNPEILKLHYDLYGRREGRVASYVFDAKYYLENNPDLVSAFGADGYEMAYYHFIRFGINEGRASSQFFDANWYVANITSVQLRFDFNYSKALDYFVTTGMASGDIASGEFSINAYINHNTDLANLFLTDYVRYYNHYLAYGKSEGRQCLNIM